MAKRTSRRRPQRPIGKTCPTRKRRFRDRLDAQIALSRSYSSNSSRRQECRYYYCHKCGGWHLTSQPKKERV